MKKPNFVKYYFISLLIFSIGLLGALLAYFELTIGPELPRQALGFIYIMTILGSVVHGIILLVHWFYFHDFSNWFICFAPLIGWLFLLLPQLYFGSFKGAFAIFIFLLAFLNCLFALYFTKPNNG
jgi:hypothetical protein